MKTIYISLPITGYDLEERRATARHQREKLMAEGWAVVDPLNQQANIPDEASWQDHMRYDLKLLLSCDAIYMMDGWHTSRGCTTECLVASDCGLEILGTICTNVHPHIVSTQSLRKLPDGGIVPKGPIYGDGEYIVTEEERCRLSQFLKEQHEADHKPDAKISGDNLFRALSNMKRKNHLP